MGGEQEQNEKSENHSRFFSGPRACGPCSPCGRCGRVRLLKSFRHSVMPVVPSCLESRAGIIYGACFRVAACINSSTNKEVPMISICSRSGKCTVDSEKEVRSGPLLAYPNRRFARNGGSPPKVPIKKLSSLCPKRLDFQCFGMPEMFIHAISISSKLSMLTFSRLFEKPAN